MHTRKHTKEMNAKQSFLLYLYEIAINS